MSRIIRGNRWKTVRMGIIRIDMVSVDSHKGLIDGAARSLRGEFPSKAKGIH
jgi:hypothetical protein